MEAKYEEDYFEDHGGGEHTTAHVDVLLFPFDAGMSSCGTTGVKIFFFPSRQPFPSNAENARGFAFDSLGSL